MNRKLMNLALVFGLAISLGTTLAACNNDANAPAGGSSPSPTTSPSK